MTGHVDLLPYLMAVIGFLIVYTLTGIKNEIRDVRKAVGLLEADLRKGLSELQKGLSGIDHRVTAIETRCEIEHNK